MIQIAVMIVLMYSAVEVSTFSKGNAHAGNYSLN